MDKKLGEMEKDALLYREGNPTAFPSLNISKGGSVEMGQMSLRELRREDQVAMDDLTEQVRTKEEEI